jgi:DtxR family Mn-dependent transcriptional regulator
VSDGFHPPVEEYLEAIYGLTEEGVPVIQARLVERLRFSAQAVSEMVHRLCADGYLIRSGRGVSFTEKGRERALSVVRRHRLAERFLVDIVGLPWHKAHEEAGRWEHVISDDVEARFIAILGRPTTCPHGSLIPGMGGELGEQMPLSMVATGAEVFLARITEQIETDPATLVYLNAHHFIPGSNIVVQERSDDGTLSVSLSNADGSHGDLVALVPRVAENMFVKVA